MKKVLYPLLLLIASVAMGQVTTNPTTVVNVPTTNPVTAAVIVLSPATIAVGNTIAFGNATSPLSQLADMTTNVPLPFDCTQMYNHCSWTTSNALVAAVTALGVVTGINAGTATITYTSTTGGAPVIGTAALTVTAIPGISFACGTPPCVLPPATTGVPYSQTFVANDGVSPYTWSVLTGSFSACGVTFSSGGVLSGSSPTAATCAVTVQVQDSTVPTPLSATLQVSLTVSGTTCGPPTYPCASTSTAIIQTPNTPPFTTPSSTGTTCTPGSANGSGNGCIGSIGYDTSINPKGVVPILRATDNSVMAGNTVSSSFSGGDNDQGVGCVGRSDWSAECGTATVYFHTVTFGGVPYFDAFQITGGQPAIVSKLPATIGKTFTGPTGAPAFSSQVHNAVFIEGSNAGDPIIHKPVLSAGSTVTVTSDPTVYDFGASCSGLPNGTSFNQQYVGILSHDVNDNIFAADVSNVVALLSGQDTATVTNGSPTVSLSGPKTLLTDGSLTNAIVKLGGVAYTISSNTSTVITLTANYAGASSSSATVAIGGGQGTGVYVLMVQLSPAACEIVNTYTGTWTGTGAWAGSGTLSNGCAGMYVHDTSMEYTGQWLHITKAMSGNANCGTTFVELQIGTGTEVACSATTTGYGSTCNGHYANGWTHEAITNNPAYVSFLPASIGGGPFTPFGLVPGTAFTTLNCETHFSWRNAASGDTQPVIISNSNNNYQTSATTSTWASPYMNEIVILTQAGVAIREGHHYILGQGSGCPGTVGPFDPTSHFNAQQAIMVVSPDGKLAFVESSELGQLGKDASGATRADEFVYLLQ